ncbi:DUF3618 domain-containing protein [Kitasatospora sp. NPDC054939]
MGTTPDQLRSHVEARRAHLAHNVDLLADRMAPRRIAHRRVDATRKRLTSVKESVMGSATDATHSTGDTARTAADTATRTAENLGHAVGDATSQMSEAVQQAPAQLRRGTRGNPIAAGLVAFGAGMLAAALLPVSEAEERAGAQLREHGSELIEPVKQTATDIVQDVKEGMREPAAQAAASIRSTAQEAVQTTKDTGQEAAQAAADDLRRAGHDAAQQTRQEIQ